MIDYYLKAIDESTMMDALSLAPIDAAIDIIGDWSECVYVDGEPVFIHIQGFHANVRSKTPITWPDTVEIMQPSMPWRVWA